MTTSFPVRVRAPNGITTIQISPEGTIGDLQQTIFSATQIPPLLQDLKIGYPPTAVTAVPSLPLSSLRLKHGDQLIVSHRSGVQSTSPSAKPPQTKPSTATPSLASAIGIPVGAASPAQTSQSGMPGGWRAGLDDYVEVDGQVLMLREVPDDNSCLFSSIAVIFEQDIGAASKLRSVVAKAIEEQPDVFSEAFLGHPRDEYIATILKSTSWGGAIELSILSDYYRTEISSFDVETGRCDRFGQEKYENRCFLMYSGIHYDAVSLAPTATAPVDFHQTVFPVSSEGMFAAAEQLAAKRRVKREFTNTATFDLRCQVCGIGVKGEKEARTHAKETGHDKFGEY